MGTCPPLPHCIRLVEISTSFFLYVFSGCALSSGSSLALYKMVLRHCVAAGVVREECPLALPLWEQQEP